jgi:DNA-binding CsgD family transcriptional regulator
MVMGLGTREIAARMGNAVGTIGAQRAALMRFYGVKTRGELLARVRAEGAGERAAGAAEGRVRGRRSVA